MSHILSIHYSYNDWEYAILNKITTKTLGRCLLFIKRHGKIKKVVLFIASIYLLITFYSISNVLWKSLFVFLLFLVAIKRASLFDCRKVDRSVDRSVGVVILWWRESCQNSDTYENNCTAHFHPLLTAFSSLPLRIILLRLLTGITAPA